MQTKYVKCITLYTAYNTAHSEVSASRPLHTAQCSGHAHCTLYISHCTYCKMCIVHCKLHIAHFKMHTAHWTLQSVHWTLQYVCCTLHLLYIANCAINSFIHCTFQTAHRTLYSSHCTLNNLYTQVCTLCTVYCIDMCHNRLIRMRR